MESFDIISKTFNKSLERRNKILDLCYHLNDTLDELGGTHINEDSFLNTARNTYEAARNKVVASAWMLHRAADELSRAKIKALKQDLDYDSDDSDSDTSDKSDSSDSETESDTENRDKTSRRIHKAEIKEKMARRDYHANMATLKVADDQLTTDCKVYLEYTQAKLKKSIDEKVAACTE